MAEILGLDKNLGLGRGWSEVRLGRGRDKSRPLTFPQWTPLLRDRRDGIHKVPHLRTKRKTNTKPLFT